MGLTRLDGRSRDSTYGRRSSPAPIENVSGGIEGVQGTHEVSSGVPDVRHRCMEPGSIHQFPSAESIEPVAAELCPEDRNALARRRRRDRRNRKDETRSPPRQEDNGGRDQADNHGEDKEGSEPRSGPLPRRWTAEPRRIETRRAVDPHATDFRLPLQTKLDLDVRVVLLDLVSLDDGAR